MNGGTTGAETSLGRKLELELELPAHVRCRNRVRGSVLYGSSYEWGGVKKDRCSVLFPKAFCVLVICDRSSMSRDDGVGEGLRGITFDLGPVVKEEMVVIWKAGRKLEIEVAAVCQNRYLRGVVVTDVREADVHSFGC